MIVRAAVEESPAALGWITRLDDDVRGHAPELVWIEVASALNRYVHAGEIRARAAQEVLGTAMRLPLNVWRLEALAAPAFQTAITLGMSVYDACYVVLAESLGATLVTADRRLATAVSDAELIPVNGRG